jgi:hypothetical protein
MYRVDDKGPQTGSSGSDSPCTTPLIDPRVAKHGGTRTNRKHTYDFPGMLADRDWRQTANVHKATRYYGCALCGVKFSGPHAVYVHLAKVHDR